MIIDNVTFEHPEYIAHKAQVIKTRNVFNGIDTAKQYIYKLERESDASIATRMEVATIKNFVKRATEAFVGMIFRKHIETSGLDDDMVAILKNIDGSHNLNRFGRELATHLIVDGRAFIGIDTLEDGSGLPYAIIYTRGQVINWRKDLSGNYTMVVVREVIEEPAGDFGMEYVVQYRVYKENGDVDLYRTNDQKTGFFYKTIQTEYDYIPIIPVDLSDVPPLYDVTKLTIKHMNRTSIKDKYLNMAATPIPLLWGIQPDESAGTKPVFVVGADEAFLFAGTKEECDFEWRELSGSSIDKLQEDLSVIEEDITSGIIRAATSDTTTIKTATQSFYEAAESSNRCVVIANALEQSLNKMLVILADIANIPLDETSQIIINKDFNAVSGNNQDLRLLWEVYLGGALSVETFLDSMAKFEVIDIGSVRDELARIQNDKFEPVSKNAPVETVNNMDNRTLSAVEE